MIIQFSIEDFKVEFETSSPERNTLTSVVKEGFSLNVVHLIRDHYTLYAKIRVKMQAKSNAFWADYEATEKIAEIPTLAYQDQATANYMKSISNAFFKPLGIALCLMLILTTTRAQDTVYAHKLKVPYNGIIDKSGHVKKVWYRTVKLEAGYYIKKDNGNYIVNGKELKSF